MGAEDLLKPSSIAEVHVKVSVEVEDSTFFFRQPFVRAAKTARQHNPILLIHMGILIRITRGECLKPPTAQYRDRGPVVHKAIVVDPAMVRRD
jgi:hypothetical protein